MENNIPPVILQHNSQDQVWEKRENFGANDRYQLPLGKTAVSFARFENHYEEATFQKYSKDFTVFKKALFNNQANAAVIDLELPTDLEINGPLELEVTLKLNDTKGLLSAQVLDYGEKLRLDDKARVKDYKVLDRGRNFMLDDLLELPLIKSPYQLVSKGFLNLQNETPQQTHSFPANEWVTVNFELQPTIYQLKKADTLRVIFTVQTSNIPSEIIEK